MGKRPQPDAGGYDDGELATRCDGGRVVISRGNRVTAVTSSARLAARRKLPTLVVVKGADTVEELSADKKVVGVLIVLGAAAAALAALFALRAAYGSLEHTDTSTDDRTAPRDSDVKRTTKYLKRSRALMIIAALALAGAIAWAWQAPEKEPAKFSVTLKYGSVVCGTYAGADTSVVRVKTPDGSTTAIPLDDVKETAFTTSC